MIHARNDYNRIQDPENKIAEDEPVFLLRSQDIFSPKVVRYWADLVDVIGGDKELANHVRSFADMMEEWQKKNESKLPDTPQIELLKLS